MAQVIELDDAGAARASIRILNWRCSWGGNGHRAGPGAVRSRAQVLDVDVDVIALLRVSSSGDTYPVRVPLLSKLWAILYD